MTIGYLEEFIEDNKVLEEAEDFEAILARQDRILRAREERRKGTAGMNGAVNGNGKRTHEEAKKAAVFEQEEQKVMEMAGGEGVLAS